MEEKNILSSWKEIGSYLKRSVATCQRWEIELGLPVHRMDGTPKARVFAYPDELDRWLAEKLHRLDDQPKKKVFFSHSLKKPLWLIPAAVLLAAGVIFIPRLFSPDLLPIPSDKPSLAVVQFEAAGADGSLEDWKTALPDLIITDLMQSRFVTVAGITELYRKLRDLKLAEAEKFSAEDLKKVAQTANVRYVATGSLKKTGRNVTVSVSVHNAGTGETAKSLETSFQNEKDIFTAADVLTEKIKLVLGLNARYVSRDIDKKVEDISTSSPQAFELFSQGYRLTGITKYQEGIPFLQKAVGLDPKFALAYKYLFLASLNSLREDDAQKYMRKAIDLASRLSERERGQTLVLFYEMYEEDPGKRLESLERLYRFYPDDWLGGQRLLNTYVGSEDWDKALPVAEQSYRVNKTNSNVNWNLCQGLIVCYENLGQVAKAGQILNGFIEDNAPRFAGGAVQFRTYFLIRRNQFDAALADAESLIANRPNYPNYFSYKGDVYLYRDDFASAEREFQRAFNKGDLNTRLGALSSLSDVSLAMGKIEEAIQRLRQCLEMVEEAEGKTGKDRPMPLSVLLAAKINSRWELAYLLRLKGQTADAFRETDAAMRDLERLKAAGGSPLSSLDILHLRALIALDMNRENEVDKQAEEIKRLIEQSQRPKLMRTYYHLFGYRELKRNNFQRAIEYFAKAVDLLSVPGGGFYGNNANPQYLYSLAEAYAQLEPGSTYRALPTYEKVTLPAFNRGRCGDLYAKSYYKIAKIHEAAYSDRNTTADDKKTSLTKAIENYRKFLSLWENADPVFAADIEDAKTRLAGLTSR